MTFFNSEIVQKELQRMQDLYLEINKMGLVLSIPQKREQLDKMIELIDIQHTEGSFLITNVQKNLLRIIRKEATQHLNWLCMIL